MIIFCLIKELAFFGYSKYIVIGRLVIFTEQVVRWMKKFRNFFSAKDLNKILKNLQIFLPFLHNLF